MHLVNPRYEPSERTLEFGEGPIGISFTSFVDIAVRYWLTETMYLRKCV